MEIDAEVLLHQILLTGDGRVIVDRAQSQIEKMERAKIKKLHPYRISQQKDGKWTTHIPAGGKEKRRRIIKSSEDELFEALSRYYDGQMYTLSEAFKDYYEDKKETGLMQSTLDRNRNDWAKFVEQDPEKIGKTPIRKVTYQMIDRWIKRTLKRCKDTGHGASEKAFRQGFYLLKGVLMLAYREDHLSENPRDIFDKVDLRRYRRLYDESRHHTEQERFLDDISLLKLKKAMKERHAKKPELIHPYAVEIALGSGLRSGEINGLRWDHIDLETGVAVIDRSTHYTFSTRTLWEGDTKTGKHRTVALTTDAVDALKAIRRIQEENGWLGEYVMMDGRGRIPLKTMENCSRSWMKKAGMPACGLNVCRRTFNERLTEAGVNVDVRCSQMGHSREVEARNYTREDLPVALKRDALQNMA